MKKKDVIEHISLEELPGDHLVQKMDLKALKYLCGILRNEIIDKTSIYGGHLSSNLGNVETVVALHHCFNFPEDKLIFDVGHQSYAHKLLSGRSLDGLRHKGGTSGFQKRSESIYDPYEAGHSSTSISAAEAFAIARDAKGENYNVIAFVGDASIANGLAFEALNSLGSQKSKVIIVLNDNEMSISKPSGGLGKFFSRISTAASYNKMKRGYRKVLTKTKFGAKIYSFTKVIKDGIKKRLVPVTLFDNLGLTYIGTVDGHNMKALIKAFERAKRSEKSVVIHIKTIKGHGYEPSEGDRHGYFHDVGPFYKDDGTPKNPSPVPSWSAFYGELVEDSLSNDEKAYLVVASTQLGSKLTGPLKQHPDRSIDMGISEEHAMTFAGALALNGYHPIVSLYSTFLQRTYDELHHDCARMNTPLTILVDRAGLVADNGETHQGIYDVAMLSSIPGVRVAMPSSTGIARAVYEESMGYNGITAIRYPKCDIVEGNIPSNYEPLSYCSFRKGHKNAIIVVGPKVNEVLKAVESRDLPYDVIDPVYLLPILDKNVDGLLCYEQIVIYDAYGVENGFASLLTAKLNQRGYRGEIFIHAVPNIFLYQATVDELEHDLGLSIEQVLETLKK